MVILDPAIKSLPVVNATVNCLLAKATRSETRAVMLTAVTTPPRVPDATATLALSRVDSTDTDSFWSAIGAPVATFFNVHTLADASQAFVVVKTNLVEPEYATVAAGAVAPPVHSTVGTEDRKKPDGKMIVMALDTPAAYAVWS